MAEEEAGAPEAIEEVEMSVLDALKDVRSIINHIAIHTASTHPSNLLSCVT